MARRESIPSIPGGAALRAGLILCVGFATMSWAFGPATPGSPGAVSDPGSENIPIFITDFGTNRLIRVTDMAGSDWQSGPTVSGLSFDGPWLFCLDSLGKIYVADRYSKRLIRTDDVAGNGWTALNVATSNPGSEPHSVAVDPASGRIYMAHGSSVVQIDDMDGTGWITFGPTPSGPGSFGNPIDLVLDAQGRLYVTDLPDGGHRIIRFDDIQGTGWTTFGSQGSGVGQFNKPEALALDSLGRIYIADGYNNRVVRIDDMTGAGWVTFGSLGSGVGQLNGPHAIAVSDSGKTYVADAGNQRIVRIDDMTGAGWIAFGSNGDGPLQFRATKGLRLDLRADLSITQTDGRESAVSGSAINYVIAVTSAGPNKATGARVKDTFPPAITLATWTCSATAGSSCGGSGGSGNIDRFVTLPPGGVVTFSVVASIDPTATGMLSNTATVTVPYGTADVAPDNNTTTDTNTIIPPLVSVYDRAVVEGGATGASFRIDVSPASVQDVTVTYATAPGTAMAGSDYTHVSGSLTFTPGRNAHSVVVPILTDMITEGSESFYFNITSVTGATILDGQAVGTISDPPTAADVPMYRAYNPNAFYHFFTTSLGEFTNAVAAGYRDESNPPCCAIPFRVPNLQGSGKAAIYRMYNPNNGRHYYTASGGERDVLMGLGWVYEKDEGFVYASQEPATVEVFKLYNNISGVHLYTVRPEEKDAILAQFPGIWFQHTSLGFAVP